MTWCGLGYKPAGTRVGLGDARRIRAPGPPPGISAGKLKTRQHGRTWPRREPPPVHDPATGGAADPIGYHRAAVRTSIPMPSITAYTRKIHAARWRRIVSAVTSRIPGRIDAP